MPRRPDLPCAGCGKLLWRGSTSLPEGQARCQACRRHGCGTVSQYSRRGCRCDRCRAANAAAHRAYDKKVAARDGVTLTEKYRPKGIPNDCEVCGLPLSYANSRAVWHRKCRPVKFYVDPERRLALYERDGWICQLCTEPVLRSTPRRHPESATLDHIVPRSLGGLNDDDNLQLAHLACNSKRGNRVPA